MTKKKDYSRKGNADWNECTRRIEDPVFGKGLTDPYMDSYQGELLTCYDILEEAGWQAKKVITLKFERSFLKKLIHSHILFIKSKDAD